MDIKKMLMGSAFYSIGNMVGAGLNLFYQFILIMFLSSQEYGIIQPLLQFVGLLILPLSAYQFALTKHYSSLNHSLLEDESLHAVRCMFLYSFIVIILWIILIPVLKQIFHIDDSNIFILLLISLLLNMPQIPFISRLQAENKFFTAGTAQALQGLVRISFGILCVWLIPNIWGAMAGILISNIAFLCANIFPYRKNFFKTISSEFKPQKFSYRLLLISLGSVGLFSALIYSDTVLVRSLLPNESALFASANLLGKGMIFLTAGVSFVILPIMATKLHNSKKALWIGFCCLFLLVIGYILFFQLTAPILAKVLFAKDPYIQSAFPYHMIFYNYMFLPYPLIYYFLNYYLVKESLFYPILLSIGISLLYYLIISFGKNIIMVDIMVGIVGYVLLLIVLLNSVFSKRH